MSYLWQGIFRRHLPSKVAVSLELAGAGTESVTGPASNTFTL